MPVNPVAAGGFSSAAATYARIRPSYARPAIGALKDRLQDGLEDRLEGGSEVGSEDPLRDAPGARRSAGGRVLDLAAGTGILTGQLVRARLDVVAVEPLDAMARQLQRSLPAVPVLSGEAESLPLAADSFDAITVGQGFHWFDAHAALDEAARVLRPGGTLALLWNVRDQSEDWVAALTELVEERTGGRPYDDHRERPWRDVVAEHGAFTELAEERFANPVPTTRDGVVDRVRSTSFVAALDPPERDDLLAAARQLLADRPELDGTFDSPHHTVLHTCRLR